MSSANASKMSSKAFSVTVVKTCERKKTLWSKEQNFLLYPCFQNCHNSELLGTQDRFVKNKLITK